MEAEKIRCKAGRIGVVWLYYLMNKSSLKPFLFELVFPRDTKGLSGSFPVTQVLSIQAFC